MTIELIALMALILRLILANQSFWLDEGASLVIARQHLGPLLTSLGADFHPPLYYLLLHLQILIGVRNEVLLRLPNILLGTATVYLLYRLLLLLDTKFKQKTALLGALILAANPLHIYYSQELRMYSLSAFLTIATWLVLLSKHKRKYVWFALLTALNFYTYYGAFFNFCAQFIYVCWQARKILKQKWFWFVIPLILFAPWLLILSQQLKGAEFLKSALPGWSNLSGVLSFKALALIPLKFVLGRVNLADNLAFKISGGLATVYLLSLMYFGRKAKASRVFLAWLLIPLVLAVISSLWSPLLGYWRYLYLAPAAAGLIALAISRLKPPYRQLNFTLVILIFALANVVFWLTPAYQRENWRGLVDFDQHYNQLTTLYVFPFSDAFAPFRWYLPTAQYVAPLKNLRSDPETLDLLLSQASEGKSTILYFEYLAAITDPQKNISHWLENAGYRLSQTHNLSGVGLIYEYHPQLLY